MSDRTFVPSTFIRYNLPPGTYFVQVTGLYGEANEFVLPHAKDDDEAKQVWEEIRESMSNEWKRAYLFQRMLQGGVEMYVRNVTAYVNLEPGKDKT